VVKGESKSRAAGDDNEGSEEIQLGEGKKNVEDLEAGKRWFVTEDGGGGGTSSRDGHQKTFIWEGKRGVGGVGVGA